MKHGIQHSKVNITLLLPRYTKETPGENIGNIFHIHRPSAYVNSLL